MKGLPIVLVGLLVGGCVAAASSAEPSASSAPTTAASPSKMTSPTPSPSPATARYPDGIPSSFDGQPVLRGEAVLAKARAMTTADPFLVGAWLDVYAGPRSCPIDTRSLPPDSWLHACQPTIRASDEAGAEPSALVAAFAPSPTATFRFATGLHSGPAILRVHVHDPRASQCGPDEATCDAMMVVETAVWSGDAATEPRPISVEAARTAVLGAVPGLSLRLLGGSDMRSGPELSDAATLQQPIPGPDPNPTWPPASQDGRITSVNVLPSVAAMTRALPKVTPGITGALQHTAVFSGQGWSGPGEGGSWYDERWLVVENVAVSILTLPTPSTADRALLARLADALQAVAGGGA